MSENKQINAYDNMVKHLHEKLEDTSETLSSGLASAKAKTNEITDLTQEEIEKISDYVQRDIEEAAHSLTHSDGESLAEWFQFDLQLLENFALDAFMSVADKTRISLARLEQQARQASIYQSGEITSPGTFTCMQCNKQISFKKTTQLPECPECGNNSFQRG